MQKNEETRTRANHREKKCSVNLKKKTLENVINFALINLDFSSPDCSGRLCLAPIYNKFLGFFLSFYFLGSKTTPRKLPLFA